MEAADLSPLSSLISCSYILNSTLVSCPSVLPLVTSMSHGVVVKVWGRCECEVWVWDVYWEELKLRVTKIICMNSLKWPRSGTVLPWGSVANSQIQSGEGSQRLSGALKQNRTALEVTLKVFTYVNRGSPRGWVGTIRPRASSEKPLFGVGLG